jgi:hypothetical protein
MFYTYVPNTIKTRKRTTPGQLEILENVFVNDKKPNAPRRKELAKKLKMSPREVQVCIVISSSTTFSFSHGAFPPFPFHLPSSPLLPLDTKTSPDLPSRFTNRCGFKTGAPRKKSRLPKKMLRLPPPPPLLA